MRFMWGAALGATVLWTGAVAARSEQLAQAIPDDTEQASSSNVPRPVAWKNIQLNGKFDAVFDIAQKDHVRATTSGVGEHTLANWDNYHSFVFLNVRVMPNTVFLGTIYVGTRIQHFFRVERSLTRNSKLVFGKIPVPFGNSPFHRFYGGVGGYQFESKIVPNIWAEPGMSLHYRREISRYLDMEGDTYAIRRPVYSGPDDGVVFSDNPSALSGIGQRFQFVVATYSTVWMSAFYDAYNVPSTLPGGPDVGKDELLVALDVYHTFQWTGVPFLRTVELNAGFARLNRDDAFDFGRFRDRHYGDYVQLTFRTWERHFRPRLRYGTFANDPTAAPDVAREHHLVATVLIPDGNLSYMVQYQRNWEDMRPGSTRGQLKNDLFRVQLLFEF